MEDGFVGDQNLVTLACYADQYSVEKSQISESYGGGDSSIPEENLQWHGPSNSLITGCKLKINMKAAKEISGPQLKFSELQMVQLLHLKKMYAGNIQDLHPAITEEDIYSCHPAELLKNGRTYLMSFSKYTGHTKPKRVRVTRSGYRWKQQGRAFTLKYNGQPVAIRTYLSFVSLGRSKNGVAGGSPDDPNYVNRPCKHGGIRRQAMYTMEEITLLEDFIYEKNLTSKGIRPCPIPVLCHILCKYKEPLYNSTEAISFSSASASASHELPCLETRHDEAGGDDMMLSAAFNGLEPLDGTVVDNDLQTLIAGLSYWESFLHL